MSNEHLSLDWMDFLVVDRGRILDYPDEYIQVCYLRELSRHQMKMMRMNFVMNKYFDVVDQHNVGFFEMLVELMEILLEDKRHVSNFSIHQYQQVDQCFYLDQSMLYNVRDHLVHLRMYLIQSYADHDWLNSIYERTMWRFYVKRMSHLL